MWDGVNMVMEMGIPETAVTQGGKYFWKEDREVPDMWHVLFDYPKKELAVSFACSFHNRHVGELMQFLGRDLTLECASEFCRTYTPDWKPGGFERMMAGHMENFIDCTRSRELPRCHVDRAFEEAVTLLMSLEAYRRDAKVRWDPVKEEIV
jgi:predicted dehydrogenase